MSQKVKQANFRLPLDYMDLIDEVAKRESITKAAVITKALDCLKASYDSGNGGLPAGASSGGVSNSEIEDLRNKLREAEDKAANAESRLKQVEERASILERTAGGNNSRILDVEQARNDALSRLSAAERDRDEARARLDSAERDRNAAEARVNDAYAARDAAEAKLRDTESRLAAAEEKARANSKPSAETLAAIAAAEDEVARLKAVAKKREESLEEQMSKLNAKDDEISRLKALVAKHEASLEERKNAYTSREKELEAKNASIAERDARIASLSEQLGAANAKIELAQTVNEVKAVMVGDAPEPADEETTRALYMFNMLGGVMGAFQQQVADARVVGEQEGRSAVQRELQETLEKARNDGYRDAMSYLDDRVTTARENGAREERARIANMSYFERRRYLRMHIA